MPLGTLLATADAAKGEAGAKACLACHDFTKGGPNKTGPDLWDVVERPIASHEGFAYSDAHEGASRPTSGPMRTSIAFLNNPKGFAPGTKMTLGGVKSATRAGRHPRLSAQRCRTARSPSPPHNRPKSHQDLTPAKALPVFPFAFRNAYLFGISLSREAEPDEPYPPQSC